MGFSEFPASRVHLWSSQQIGSPVELSINSKSIGGIIISEHVLRRTAKLATHQRTSFDCYLLGTVSRSNDCLSVNIDRIDQGKEVISDGQIVKVPTMLIPGDVIVPTTILSEEDTLAFTTEQYLATFTELEERLKQQCALCDLLKIKCIISLMPDDDLGTPLKVTCEMVHPGLGFQLKPISPLPLASTPITRALSGDLAGVTKHGYLTLDRARRGVLLLSNDASAISDNILVGAWLSLPLSHPINADSNYPLSPQAWHRLIMYLFNQDIVRESPLPAPFLLCVLSGGTVLTWEVSLATAHPHFNQIKCTRYVVVPATNTSDTTTFHLEPVSPHTDSHKMFSSALGTVKHNLWEKSTEDIEPRAAPLATPTAKAAKSRKEAPRPTRSISPLSILVPSCMGSIMGPPSGFQTAEKTAEQDGSVYEGSRTPQKEKQSSTAPVYKDLPHENGNPYPPQENGPPQPDMARDPSLDPTYPPNTLLSPPGFPNSPYDPRFVYPRGESNTDLYSHARQGSDPYVGHHSPMSPYYFNPYIDPRYQYPYHPGYTAAMYHGMPHNVPAFYPPNYSPSSWRNKKPSKEKSAFRSLGRTSPNKRTNHRSPEKSSFSSLNKSVCSTSTVSSRDSTHTSSRSRKSGGSGTRSTAKKQLYADERDLTNTPRSVKSSTSSSVSDRRKNGCTRDAANKTSGRSSRTASSQSESASISAKALKMLTLQKRQLDHLQQQVSLLMKNAHTTTHQTSNVESLDKSIECMREQMEILEQQIDKGGPSSTETNDMCVGTGESLVLTESTGTNMTQHDVSEHSAQHSAPCASQHSAPCASQHSAPCASQHSAPCASQHSVQYSSQHSVQCTSVEESVAEASEDSGSFYMRFKENCDPQQNNGWESSGQYSRHHGPKDTSPNYVTKDPSPKYREHSIYQHPKIQAPALSHSIYNSYCFDVEDEVVVPTRGADFSLATRGASPENFSLASRKYLEKHQLVSPPTRHVTKHSEKKKKGRSERGERVVYRNGKIVTLRCNGGSDPEQDMQRLQLK